MINKISTTKLLLIDMPYVFVRDIKKLDIPLILDFPLILNPTEKITNLYSLYREALFVYVLLRVSTREKAQDIVQETFTKVWEYMSEDNTIIHEKSFLYTTAHHLIIDDYRKKKCVSLEGIMNTREEPAFALEESIIDPVELAHIMKCIRNLPQIYHSVLILRYVDDLSIKSIARSMKVSESVVSVRISRGLQKLRYQMKSFL
jgi:RNA polymerase sigma-70 factor (ECF subfamily)